MFISKYLTPAFAEANLSTKILCYDWNWGDLPAYPEEVLSASNAAYMSIAGVSWHRYAGNASQMSVF